MQYNSLAIQMQSGIDVILVFAFGDADVDQIDPIICQPTFFHQTSRAPWQEVVMRFLDNPHSFAGLHRLAGVPNREPVKLKGDP